MPYRRLPNTDKARIAALEKAVEMEYKYSKFELAASYKTLNEARSFLNKFKTAYRLSKQTICRFIIRRPSMQLLPWDLLQVPKHLRT